MPEQTAVAELSENQSKVELGRLARELSAHNVAYYTNDKPTVIKHFIGIERQ